MVLPQGAIEINEPERNESILVDLHRLIQIMCSAASRHRAARIMVSRSVSVAFEQHQGRVEEQWMIFGGLTIAHTHSHGAD
jgi:hypothetical protein